MKMPSSIIVALLIFMTLITPACKKDDTYMNNAVIIGEDVRMCACCGGLEITIENVQTPGGFFLVRQLPSDFSLGDNPNFPIPVKIDWQTDSFRCYGNFIRILRIAKR